VRERVGARGGSESLSKPTTPLHPLTTRASRRGNESHPSNDNDSVIVCHSALAAPCTSPITTEQPDSVIKSCRDDHDNDYVPHLTPSLLTHPNHTTISLDAYEEPLETNTTKMQASSPPSRRTLAQPIHRPDPTHASAISPSPVYPPSPLHFIYILVILNVSMYF